MKHQTIHDWRRIGSGKNVCFLGMIRMQQQSAIYIKSRYFCIIHFTMARTKQTARKTTVQMVPRKKLIASKTARKSGPGGRFVEEEIEEELDEVVNTQQFSLKFDDQEKCQEGAVQQPLIACSGCQAYYTIQSELILKAAYTTMKNDPNLSDAEKQKFLDKFNNVWICQFCLQHNNIPVNYLPPKAENPCILLEKVKNKNKKEENSANKILIFCIDISGSMDFQFSGKSRLESVKEAIIDEVNRLKFEKQKIKIGLVTFGSYVSFVHLHGVKKKDDQQTQLHHELYKDFDAIVKEVEKMGVFCHPIETVYETAKEAIRGLCTCGSTALGPGLLSAVELASKGSLGSKVILCTDGEANVGIGGSFNMDRFTFYTRMAEYAKKKRVMVNILSLKGDNCNLKELGKLSLATGGAILKIDPALLGTQFTKIVKENVIGSNSKLIVKLNKIFTICNAQPDEVSKDQTTLTQDFGNFSADTQLSFEFATIPVSQAEKMPEIDMALYKRKRVPMQIQLEYIGRKGEKYLQIVTDWRELTHNLDDIYEGADFRLFVVSVLQRASTKIKNAQYKEAHSILNGYWSIVEEKFKKTEKQEELNRFAERVRKLERILGSKMKKNNVQKFAKKKRPASGKQEEKAFSKSKAIPKSREKAAKKGRKAKQSSEDEDFAQEEASEQIMHSDSEQVVLLQEMRARQRSRSRSPSIERSREKKAKPTRTQSVSTVKTEQRARRRK